MGASESHESLIAQRYENGNVSKYRFGKLKLTDIPRGADIRLRAIGDLEKVNAELQKLSPGVRPFNLHCRYRGQDYMDTVFDLDKHEDIQKILQCPWLVDVAWLEKILNSLS